MRSEEDSGGRLPTACIFTWHRCALFIRVEGSSVLSIYIPDWRRHLLLSILDALGFPRTATRQGIKRQCDSYAISIYQDGFHFWFIINNISAIGVGGANSDGIHYGKEKDCGN